MRNAISKIILEKIELLKIIDTNGYMDKVVETADLLSGIIAAGNKIFIAGNGGSAADAQHFAGEIVGRFLKERNALPAISLCVDPSVMTCIANDYGYDMVFARQIEGLGQKGDAAIFISTSGNSLNCIKAIDVAKRKGILTIGLLGKNGGKMESMCDMALVVPSDSTPRIQEIHTFTVHMLCQLIENAIFKD